MTMHPSCPTRQGSPNSTLQIRYCRGATGCRPPRQSGLLYRSLHVRHIRRHCLTGQMLLKLSYLQPVRLFAFKEVGLTSRCSRPPAVTWPLRGDLFLGSYSDSVCDNPCDDLIVWTPAGYSRRLLLGLQRRLPHPAGKMTDNEHLG